MISRLANYPDLFTFDAKYHKYCYGHSISHRNISSQIRYNKSLRVLNDDEKHLKEENPSFSSSSDKDSDPAPHVFEPCELPDMVILHRAAAI